MGAHSRPGLDEYFPRLQKGECLWRSYEHKKDMGVPAKKQVAGACTVDHPEDQPGQVSISWWSVVVSKRAKWGPVVNRQCFKNNPILNHSCPQLLMRQGRNPWVDDWNTSIRVGFAVWTPGNRMRSQDILGRSFLKHCIWPWKASPLRSEDHNTRMSALGIFALAETAFSRNMI